ncbi:MAG: hypothetical protein ACRYFX_14445 [Janthinobacterium lividum]
MVFLLAGCETRQRAATSAPAAPVAAAPAPAAMQVPRQPPAPTMANLPMWANTSDTNATRLRLTLDGQPWRVHTAAQADSSHPLTFRIPADKENHVPAIVEKGAEVQYIFQLLDPQGRPRFTTRLHKADFAQAVYGSLRTVAIAAPPDFLAYWPARRALVFEVGFGRDETDEGLDVLVLLDAATGRVLHLTLGKAYMGSCDCWPTLTPDGQTLLTGQEILRATGQIIPLAKNARAVAGTSILNDSTFLVVYEGENPTLANNAQLVGRTGRVMRRFTFHGTDRGMSGGGYRLAAALVPTTGTHYLWDGATHVLTLIPVRNPTALRQLPAARLVPFLAPQRPSEKKLEFVYNDLPDAVLYVDTLTQQLRYADIKVVY